MSQAVQSPVLGSSRMAPYTHADFSKDLQVYHLMNKHHPNQLYDGISKTFVNSIELQQDPSNDYSHKMKNLYMDQLDTSLNQYKKRIHKMSSQAEQFRRDYKQNVNTMILYMQKQQNRRNQALKQCLKKQEERQNRFIDAQKIRNKKIQDHINYNEFSNSLAQAKYQLVNQKYIEGQNSRGKTIDVVNTYGNQCTKQKSYTIGISKPKQKQSIHVKTQSEQQITRNNKIQNIEISNKRNSGNLIQKTMANGLNEQRIFRVHNPITNPIQYHIDNPYFINRMQKKYTHA